MEMGPSSIARIKEELSQAHRLSPERKQMLENDPRKGVRRLFRLWEERQFRARRLIEKFNEMNRMEDDLHGQGVKNIAGIDEAGRGPLAGPVVAACVILNPTVVLPGINDSKQLSAAKRNEYYDQIKKTAVSIGIGIVSAHEIDEINIYRAAKKAMLLAVGQMSVRPGHLLIDAMELPVDLDQTSLIKGDARSNSIAAASIIAKVTRDRIMDGLDEVYPGYGFSGHKGYGTRQHLQAIGKLGPCPEHRLTFAPLKR